MSKTRFTLFDLSDKKNLLAWSGFDEEGWNSYRQELRLAWLKSSDNPHRPQSYKQFLNWCHRGKLPWKLPKNLQPSHAAYPIPLDEDYKDWLTKMKRAVSARVSKPGGFPYKALIAECKRMAIKDRKLICESGGSVHWARSIVVSVP